MNNRNPNFKKIIDLKSIIEENLSKFIASDFVLLDVPNHRNIGDSLIWKGELEYFSNLKYKLIYQCNRSAFNGAEIKLSTTILLHGGGNFGDIYSTSQDFRLFIIDKYKENPIIMMPQSVHYNSISKMENDFAEMNKHNNLIICLRDLDSYNLLLQYFNQDKLLLLPDMAFCLDLSDFQNDRKTNVNLFMQRTDAELDKMADINLYGGVGFDFQNAEIRDWPTYSNNSIINSLNVKVDSMEAKISSLIKYVPFFKQFIDPAYGLKPRNNVDLLVEAGINFFNNYDEILTTRLHGLILGVLLGKEVYILDNSYGKNSRFYNTWLADFQKVHLIKASMKNEC